MKKLAIFTAVALGLAAPAIAAEANMKAEVVERDARGHATKVVIDGKTYPVCTSDASDGCINPREAGLNWGNRPLAYWPGQPASEGGA